MGTWALPTVAWDPTQPGRGGVRNIPTSAQVTQNPRIHYLYSILARVSPAQMPEYPRPQTPEYVAIPELLRAVDTRVYRPAYTRVTGILGSAGLSAYTAENAGYLGGAGYRPYTLRICISRCLRGADSRAVSGGVICRRGAVSGWREYNRSRGIYLLLVT